MTWMLVAPGASLRRPRDCPLGVGLSDSDQGDPQAAKCSWTPAEMATNDVGQAGTGASLTVCVSERAARRPTIRRPDEEREPARSGGARGIPSCLMECADLPRVARPRAARSVGCIVDGAGTVQRRFRAPVTLGARTRRPTMYRWAIWLPIERPRYCCLRTASEPPGRPLCSPSLAVRVTSHRGRAILDPLPTLLASRS